MPRIGRYENPHRAVEWDREPPEGTRCEPLTLPTPDRGLSHGWLYRRGGEDTVLCLMHPRANFSRHYLVPGLLDAGFAVLCQNSRWLGNDATCVHERLLLEVAEGLRAARARFERVVLVGNSGGGSLYTFYLSQALAPPEARLTRTVTGEPVDLTSADLPAADAMVYLAAHPGEGHFLLRAIDPSVVDEGDPVACEPTLDLYEPANGFAEPPAESRYAPQFLAAYREAQRARVERLDAMARARLARRRLARARFLRSGSSADRRAATATDYLLVYRTDADPRCVDLSLDPSRRDYGSLWGRRPDVLNYGPVGFARVLTPEAWLSTWSGLSSRAEIARTGSRMTLPALHVAYAADNAIFPSDHELVVRSLGSTRVDRVELEADHYGFPAARGREPAVEAMASWLRGLP
jgi:hypothetical protein